MLLWLLSRTVNWGLCFSAADAKSLGSNLCLASTALGAPSFPPLLRTTASMILILDCMSPYVVFCIAESNAVLYGRWDQEMFELSEVVDTANPIMGPLGDAGEGVVGARSGREVIRLHPGALFALQRFHAGQYPGMRAAAASSADTPKAERIG